MAPEELTRREKRELEALVRQHREASVVKRAQALLWLDEGVPVPEVAHRLRVTARSVYGWVQWLHQDRGDTVVDRLQDRTRTGRPARLRELVQETLDEVMGQDPRDWGHEGAVWTVPLLQKQVQSDHQQPVSDDTVRRALQDWDYSYKQSRYVLARRSATWRQAKGGYNGA